MALKPGRGARESRIFLRQDKERSVKSWETATKVTNWDCKAQQQN